jgi:hypothetical protein
MSNHKFQKTPIAHKSEYNFQNKENNGHQITSSAINNMKRDLQQELKEGIQEIGKIISSEISSLSKLVKDLRSEVNDLKEQVEILCHNSSSPNNIKETVNQNKYCISFDSNGFKKILEDPKFMMSVFNHNKIVEFSKLRYYTSFFICKNFKIMKDYLNNKEIIYYLCL